MKEAEQKQSHMAAAAAEPAAEILENAELTETDKVLSSIPNFDKNRFFGRCQKGF